MQYRFTQTILHSQSAWRRREWMIFVTILFYSIYAFFESIPLLGSLCNILLIFGYLVLGERQKSTAQIERN